MCFCYKKQHTSHSCCLVWNKPNCQKIKKTAKSPGWNSVWCAYCSFRRWTPKPNNKKIREIFKENVVKNPGRITFPQPPDFTGTSFLKQILTEITEDKNKLMEKFNFNKHKLILDNLWLWLDFVTPYLWKQGKSYPKNYWTWR